MQRANWPGFVPRQQCPNESPAIQVWPAQSKDYFQTWKTLVPHGNRFFMGPHGHVFAAQVDINDESKINLTGNLLSSSRNQTNNDEFVNSDE